MFRFNLPYLISHAGFMIIKTFQKPKCVRFVLRFTLGVIVLLASASFLASIASYQRTLGQTSSFDGLTQLQEFLIDTEGCRIPFIHPYDKSVLPYLLKSESVNCTSKIPSLTIQSLNKIKVNTKALSWFPDLSYCHYIPIVKPEDGKRLFQFQKEQTVKFIDEAEVETDFMKVQCFTKNHKEIFVNFHAFTIPDKKRKRLKRSTEDDGNLNVVLLGIDSLSRNQFIRKLPETRNYILNDLGGVELLGYNKVADNTFPNIIPLTLGISVAQLRKHLRWKQNIPFDKFDFIWKKFKRGNYITFYAEDMPSYGTFDYMKKGFAKSPVDHFYSPMAAAAEAHSQLWHKEQCFIDRMEAESILRYASDYFNVYKNEKHFAYIFLSRLFHETDKGVAEADKMFLDFFRDLNSNGNMRNTMFIVFSDHGSRFGSLRRSPVGRLEERLPAAYVIVPKEYKLHNDNVFQTLTQNSKKLLTPYDIHETLLDVLHATKNRTMNSDVGISLFREIPSHRDCRMAGITQNWCTCSLFKPLNTSSEISRRIGNLLIEHINHLLSDYECYKLRIEEIRSVWIWNITAANSRFNGIATTSLIDKSDYVVDIQTSPGGGIFEATIPYRNGKYNFREIFISRLNPYRGLSDCVNVFPAKKLCYCKPHKKTTT